MKMMMLFSCVNSVIPVEYACEDHPNNGMARCVKVLAQGTACRQMAHGL